MIRLIGAVCLAIICSASAHAQEMQLTIYDDGKSCPGGCDAHVVIHRQDNGTRFAFRPDSSRSNPKRCETGEMCRICFGEADDSCMDARYRGGGPPRGKFDFTPAFYDEFCGDAGIPVALQRQCDLLDIAVGAQGYDTRVNCFAEPDHAQCRDVVRAAAEAQRLDSEKYESCVAMGQDSYNSAQTDPREKRSNACAYSDQRLGGPNSQGVRWRILLPGACREGTFVGRDGLDCCSSNLRFAASVHPECTRFFPRPD